MSTRTGGCVRQKAALIVMCACSLLYAPRVAAQRDPSADPLAHVKRLTCTFSAAVSGSWDKGEATAVVKPRGAPLTFTIDRIDTQEGTARIVNGPTGLAEVVVRLAGWSLHFMDIGPLGSLTVTTVFSQDSRNGKLKAVQTRMDYVPVSLPGVPSVPDVSQQYGECEVRQ